jgi:hypothetical protein
MSIDLVERLRTRADRWWPEDGDSGGILDKEAADEIERLRKLYALESAMKRDLHAESERLRAALQQIVMEADSDDGMTAWDGGDIARRALEQK